MSTRRAVDAYVAAGEKGREGDPSEVVDALGYLTAGPCRGYSVRPAHVAGTRFEVVDEDLRIDLWVEGDRWRVECAHIEAARQLMHALGELEGVYGIVDGRPIAEWLEEHWAGRNERERLRRLGVGL